MNFFQPLYVMEAQGREIHTISSTEYDDLTEKISTYGGMSALKVNDTWREALSRQSRSFIGEYGTSDILKVLFRPVTEVYWPISRNSLEALMSQLENGTIKFNVGLSFERTPEDKKEPKVHTISFSIPAKDKTAEALRQALVDNSSTVIISVVSWFNLSF